MSPILLLNIETYENAPRGLVVLQALIDLIPVGLFLAASIILLHALHNKMTKAGYALFGGGSVMVAASGALKALHKFFIGAAQVDYSILDKQFMPTQSVGFFLMFIALLLMVIKALKKGTEVRSIVAPVFLFAVLVIPEYTSSLPFVVMMIVGGAGTLISMAVLSARLKNIPAAICFGLSIVAMLAMGYMSSRSSYSTAWFQILINTAFQGLYLAGALLLTKKSNLGDPDCFPH